MNDIGNKRIYVGNLPWSFNEEDVKRIFAEYGEVKSVHLPVDRETGRVRGFGFVEMDLEGGEKAIASLDGSDAGGRSLRVSEAQPRPDRRGGSSTYQGGQGGRGGGGGRQGGGGGRRERRDRGQQWDE